MARVIKNQEEYHAVTILGDQGKESLAVLVKGARPYLALFAPRGESFLSISGNKTLRALANAILKTVKR